MLIHLIFYHGSRSPFYILQTHNSSIYKWSIKFWTQWMMFRNSDSFEVNLHLLACSLGIVLGCNSHVCSDLIKPQKCWQPSSKPQLLWKWFLLRQPKSFLKVVIEELFLSSKFSKSGLIYMSLTHSKEQKYKFSKVQIVSLGVNWNNQNSALHMWKY